MLYIIVPAVLSFIIGFISGFLVKITYVKNKEIKHIENTKYL